MIEEVEVGALLLTSLEEVYPIGITVAVEIIMVVPVCISLNKV